MFTTTTECCWPEARDDETEHGWRPASASRCEFGTETLIGGWTHPFEIYDRQNGSFPNFRVENKAIFETATTEINDHQHVFSENRPNKLHDIHYLKRNHLCNEVILSLQIPIIFTARLNTVVIVVATQTMHHYRGNPSKIPYVCIVSSTQNGWPSMIHVEGGGLWNSAVCLVFGAHLCREKP